MKPKTLNFLGFFLFFFRELVGRTEANRATVSPAHQKRRAVMKTVQFRAPIVFFFPIDWPAGAFSISIDWHSEFLPTPSIALTIIASIIDSSRCLGF